MTEPPRKRFQIHLSTAIVMMFVAGGLIWANVKGDGLYSNRNGLEWTVYGWPIPTVLVFSDPLRNNEEPIVYRNMIADLWIAFTLLYFTYRICEYLIRRRAAQKGA